MRTIWICSSLNEILSIFDRIVSCGNAACNKGYRVRDGLDLESMTLCCPHCRGGEAQPGGLSIAWAGEGFACDRCNRRVPTTAEYFYKNVGFLFWRYTNEIGGIRCRRCLDKDFWESSILSGLFGWYGIISLPLNPFLLWINFFRYMRSIGMKESLPESESDAQTKSLIAEDFPNVLLELENPKVSHVAACMNAAKRLGVSPIDVRLALQESIRRQASKHLGRA